MFEKILALISVLSFAGFVGILIYYVREPDLMIICVAVILMAFYDFFLLNRKKTETDTGTKPPA